MINMVTVGVYREDATGGGGNVVSLSPRIDAQTCNPPAKGR